MLADSEAGCSASLGDAERFVLVVVLGFSAAAIEGETLRFALPSGRLACPEGGGGDTTVDEIPSGRRGKSVSRNRTIIASDLSLWKQEGVGA